MGFRGSLPNSVAGQLPEFGTREITNHEVLDGESDRETGLARMRVRWIVFLLLSFQLMFVFT